MRPRAWRRVLSGAFATLAAAACGSSLGAEPADAGRPTTLGAWDQSIAALHEHVWASYESTEALGRDLRGRTIRDDLDDWVTTPQALATLRAARAAAVERSRAGDARGAAAALDGADPVRRQWAVGLDLVDHYWTVRFILDRHREIWESWARRAPDDARQASRARLQEVEEGLVVGLKPSISADELDARFERARRVYNGERERLAHVVGTGGGDGLVPGPRVLQRRCPPAAPRPAPAGAGAPAASALRLQAARPAPDEAYPWPARTYGMWGDVRLRLAVDTGGCVTRAELVSSSGSFALDSAAQDWAVSVAFVPAVAGGHPVASAAVVEVSYLLGRQQVPADISGSTRPSNVRSADPVSVLGGVTLGMTRRQLREAKGRPAAVMGSSWAYNTVDAAHDGLLTAHFGQGVEADDDPVLFVEYVGNRECAPHELPPLIGATMSELVRRYGNATNPNPAGAAGGIILFPNGVGVSLSDGKVESYGIVDVRRAPPEPEVIVTLVEAHPP
jgi:TonB family protein